MIVQQTTSLGKDGPIQPSHRCTTRPRGERGALHSSSVAFIYKFNGVKRELKKLKLIPDWLWCEIRDECIVLPIRGECHAIVQDEDEMEAEPSRRTNASI